MRYLLVGSVVEIKSGRPLPALRVTAYDADRKMNHQVGEELTARDGSFHMWFLEDQFHNAGCEQGPVLHIRVVDEKGNELFRTCGPVPIGVFEKEHFKIEIPENPLGEKEMKPRQHLKTSLSPAHCSSHRCHGLRD